MRLLSRPSRRRLGILAGGAVLGVLGPGRAGAHDGLHLHRVELTGFAFAPRTLTIRAGDSVAWTNRDLAPHTATDRGGAWDTGELARGASATIAFPVPGRFACFCAFHPHMTAEIVVTPS
jgi:plastocyanin